jgi:hypothetical protein
MDEYHLTWLTTNNSFKFLFFFFPRKKVKTTSILCEIIFAYLHLQTYPNLHPSQQHSLGCQAASLKNNSKRKKKLQVTEIAIEHNYKFQAVKSVINREGKPRTNPKG